MIDLQVFGTLALTDARGEDIRSVLAQPKRVALLVYLAISRPHGFHRRDTLLALLWPEQDEQHARWALNQALRHLRNALGRDVVTSRGDGEIGIDPRELSCDAAEFERAIEADDLPGALGHYRGDLLEGFHVSGCGEFERWLEEERVWLRQRAARAASALALREEGRGESVAAGHWARQALALSPDNEGEARRLIELLGRVGDRAGAIQAYEEFVRRLRDEYEAEPAPETRALIAAVRARQEPALKPTPQFSEPKSLPVADHGGPANDGKQVALMETRAAVRPSKSRRMRSLALWILLLASVGAMVWGTWPGRASKATSETSSNTIAVFPFAYHGSPELAYLGEGMVDLLSANLNGAGELRGVEPRAVMALVRQAGAGATAPEQIKRIADRLSAGSFVLGEVIETGGRLRISARLRQSGIDEENGLNATVEGLPTQLFQLVDALTVQLLRARSEGSIPTPGGLAAVTTDSLTALKVYLEGERAYRAGRGEQAIKAFQRATEIDTSFALGYYRLAGFAEWSGWGWDAEAQEALDRAVRHSQRLGHQHRVLIRAMVAHRENRNVEAERLYRQVVTAYPSDFEAWFQLGHVIAHNNPDAVWLDARGPYERALALEPRHATALIELTQIAARERRRTEVDTLTELLLQFDLPPFFAAYVRAQRATVFADSVEIGRFISLIRKSADAEAQLGAGLLTYTTGDLALGRRLWGLITHPSRSKGYRVLAYKTLAQIELMNGRWHAAQRQLDTAATLDPATALEHRALFSLWPLQQVSRSELIALRDSVQRWKAVPGPSNETSLTAEHGPAHPYLRLYLVGLLDAHLGDTTAALTHATELERRAGSAFAPKFVTNLGRGVRAEVARLNGRLEQALRILEPRMDGTEADSAGNVSPFFGNEYQAFAAADLLYRLGRHDEALIRYSGLAAHLFHSGAPAHLRMAEIYEQKGDRRKAAEHYAHFVELWKDCDPELRPVVEGARHRLAAL